MKSSHWADSDTFNNMHVLVNHIHVINLSKTADLSVQDVKDMAVCVCV